MSPWRQPPDRLEVCVIEGAHQQYVEARNIFGNCAPVRCGRSTRHRRSGKVSYLVYPDFETDPHPSLPRSIKRNLRSREIDSTDYARSANPPILHRKETFLPPDHPLRSKFERLTRQEERAGLLEESATIGTRAG
jgi:DNA phosphorothioation-associated putative methyltransferase